MIETNKDVKDYFDKNVRIRKSIIEKIEKCLEENLFVNLKSCNKHELKGNCAGYWRLNVSYNHVVIYTIEGNRPERHAVIIKIMTEKEYHNWIKAC